MQLKNKITLLLITILQTLLLVSIVFTRSFVTVEKANAQLVPSNPAEAAAWNAAAQCMSAPMLAYLQALVAARDAGLLGPNVGLLSPVFNLTSNSFGSYLNALLGGLSGVDGYAGNIYTTGPTNNLQFYLDNQKVLENFAGKPIYITETGTKIEGGKDAFIEELGQMLDKYGPDVIAGVTLFNPFNSNQQWEQSSWTDAELAKLCGRVDCNRIGANYAGSTYDYSKAQSFGMGYVVNIVDSNSNAGALAQGINNFNGKVILRVGVGMDAGFGSVNDYMNFISQVSAATGKEFLAIAGPNEPDLEFWISPECMALVMDYLPVSAFTCGDRTPYAPVVYYKTEIIGHNGRAPWSLASNVYDYADNDNGTSPPDINQMASLLYSGFEVEVYEKYNHDDVELISRQMTGALQGPGRTALAYEPRTVDSNALNIPLLNSTNTGTKLPGGFGFGEQDVYDITTGETIEQYLKRVLNKSTATLPKDDGLEFGLVTEMPALVFRACLQRTWCDPRRDDCLRAVGSGYCDLNDNPKDCVSEGKVFVMKGRISHEEPNDLHSISRSYNISKNMLTDQPGKIFNYGDLFSPEDIASYYAATNTDSFADMAFNYVPATQDSLTMNDSNIQDSKTPSVSEKVESAVGNIIKPKVTAQAQTGDPNQPQGLLGVNVEELGSNQFRLSYSFCMWAPSNGSPCSIRDVNGVINGVEYITMGTYNILGVGPENAQCYKPEWGNAPALPNGGVVTLLPGQCSDVISARARGGRVGPEGCQDFVEDGCQVCALAAPGPDGKMFTQTCGVIPPPPPVDCRNCPSWAPAHLCKPIRTNEVIREQECVSGKCTTGGQIQVDKINWDAQGPGGGIEWAGGINLNIQSIWEAFIRWAAPFTGGILEFFGQSGAVCKEETGSVDPVTNKIEPGELTCWFNSKDYFVYAYPLNYEGDFKDKSEYMAMHNSLFRMAEKTDTYFRPDSTMIPIQLKLSVVNTSAERENGDKLQGGNFSNTNRGVWDGISDMVGNTGQFFNDVEDAFTKERYYIGFNDSAIRVMYVEFWEFFQPQMSGHCLKLRDLTQPYDDEEREVPQEQNALCSFQDFWLTGSPRNNAMVIPVNNQKLSQEFKENYAGKEGVQHSLAEFNVNDEIGKLARQDYAQTIMEEYKQKNAERSRKLSYVQEEEIANQYLKEFTFIYNKYKKSNSKMKFEDLETWPVALKNEIESLSKRYVTKYNLPVKVEG